jgi:hypothetical protein
MENFVKYFPRLKIYKDYSGKCIFNPETGQGTSYHWWRAVDKIGPFTVTNAYRYSPTTSKHLRKLDGVLNDLKIKVDFDISYPQGIQDTKAALEYLEMLSKAILGALNTKGSRKARNEERKAILVRLETESQAVKLLEKLRDTKGPKAKAKLVRKLRALSKSLARSPVYQQAATWEYQYINNKATARARKLREQQRAAADQSQPALALVQGGAS